MGESSESSGGQCAASTRRVLPCAIATIIRWLWEQYPLNRVADGETFTDVVVEVRQADDPDSFWCTAYGA